jgi:hypothetical protein
MIRGICKYSLAAAIVYGQPGTAKREPVSPSASATGAQKAFIINSRPNYQREYKSTITNTANTMLAMPFAVMNARFTFRRSCGLTIDC